MIFSSSNFFSTRSHQSAPRNSGNRNRGRIFLGAPTSPSAGLIAGLIASNADEDVGAPREDTPIKNIFSNEMVLTLGMLIDDMAEQKS